MEHLPSLYTEVRRRGVLEIATNGV
jgi:hypothetical protein